MTQRESPNPERESVLAAAHSLTVRDIVRVVEEVCKPTGDGWRKPLRLALARLLFAPLAEGEPFTRERINALLREVMLHAAALNPRPVSRRGLVRDTTMTDRPDDD